MISRGKLILMADADGATKFSDIDKVEAALNDLNPKPVRLFIFYVSFTHPAVWKCDSSTVHREHQEHQEHLHPVLKKRNKKLKIS